MTAAFLIVLIAAATLGGWRYREQRLPDQAWRELAARSTESASRFDPAMVNGLPEPARRYFHYVIYRGAPLTGAAEIYMHGELGLGDKASPRYQPMKAKQILAPPHGFVWQVRSGPAWLRISGSDGLSDGHSWSRFWLAGLLPVGRAGGTEDHRRASFGRMVGEAAFWTPAALLPGPGVTWMAVDVDTARAVVEFDGLSQSVDITVAEDGQPTMVVLPRWTDANADKAFRLQPFGGYLSEFRDFGGYRLPTRVDGGNFIGTDDYFPFFRAIVDDVRFPGIDAGEGGF